MSAKALTLDELAEAYEQAAELYDVLEGRSDSAALLVQLAALIDALEAQLNAADPLTDETSGAVL